MAAGSPGVLAGGQTGSRQPALQPHAVLQSASVPHGPLAPRPTRPLALGWHPTWPLALDQRPTRPLGPASHTALGPGLASRTALDPSAPWACSQFHSVLQDPWAEQGQGEASMPGWAPGAVRWDSPECPPPLKGAKGAPGSQAGQVAKLSFEPSVRLHSTLPCSSGPCLPHGTPDMLGAGGQRLLTHPCMLQTRRPVLTGHHTSP